MTTLTTICGLIPMALGLGEGAETDAFLAISVIGGLFVSTFLTLVFVPTLYMIVKNWSANRKNERVKGFRIQGRTVRSNEFGEINRSHYSEQFI